MTISKFFYLISKLYKRSQLLNHEHIITVNKFIKKKRILQYTGSIFHTFPLLYNILNNRCKVTHVWKCFHIMLIITSFGNHRFQSCRWLLFDRIAIGFNGYISLLLFYKNNKHMSLHIKIAFIWLFFGSIFAYIFGILTNTLCFDERFGYILHALCHVATAIACYIVLSHNN